MKTPVGVPGFRARLFQFKSVKMLSARIPTSVRLLFAKFRSSEDFSYFNLEKSLPLVVENNLDRLPSIFASYLMNIKRVGFESSCKVINQTVSSSRS